MAQAEAPLLLVVDDDPIIRLDVSGILNEAGYRTVVAANAEEALGALEQARPDGIVTDLYMEHGGGISLIRKVRANDPDLPIVAMSGHAKRYRELDRAEMVGANGSLGKPIQRFELLDLITRLIRR
jgi:CheY-like chemotaxis protein